MWPRGNSHNLQESPPAAASLPTTDEYSQPSFIPNSFTSNYTLGLANSQNIFTPPSTHSSFTSITSSPARTEAVTMSGNSAAKIGLDARAAELKEKLLKSRSQSQARINQAQTTPNPARVSTKAPALAPSMTASSSGPSSERAKPERAKPSSATFIPHEIPRQPAETSIAADANDIAALISSISSSVGEIPGLSINTPSSVTPKPQTQPAMPANGQASLPPKPPVKISIPMPPKRTVSAQTKQPQQPSVVVPGKTPLKPQINTTEESSPEEGEITRTGQKNGATVSDKTPARTAPKSAAATPAPKINAAQSAVTSNSRRELARDRTEPTPTKPFVRDVGNKPPTPTVSKPTPAPKQPILASVKVEAPKGVQSNSNGQSIASAKETNHKAAAAAPKLISSDKLIPSEDAFTRLLAQVPDIKDWLEITDYYNVDTRTRKLDRFRRGKALAAERLRIEEEERRLMEEEELDMGMHRSTFARVASAVPGAPTGSERASVSLPTPITPMASELKDTAPTTSTKRAHDESSHEARMEKMPRLGEAPSHSEDTDNRARESERRDERPDDRRDSQTDNVDTRMQPPSRGPSPHRRPLSSPRPDYRRSPPSRPREYSPHRQPRSGTRYRAEFDDLDDRSRKYDRYKGDSAHLLESPRRRDSGQHVTYPIHVDLGRKGDTRFFILKSFNEENVRRCMEENIWTTQVENGQILTTAFANCKNVILFFSINRSKAFQGYARMASTPSPDTPRPKWVNGIHWDTSHPFRIEWLSKTSVDFFRIGHLKNAYNDGAAVLVGKDGQEIEEECGTALLKEMEAYADGSAVPYQPRRENGYGGYGKRFIKREGSPERR